MDRDADADGPNTGVLDTGDPYFGKVLWLRRWSDVTNRMEKRVGPMHIPDQKYYIWKEQQAEVIRLTNCKPVIRYRRPWRIMGRVNVHDKMQGMLWL